MIYQCAYRARASITVSFMLAGTTTNHRSGADQLSLLRATGAGYGFDFGFNEVNHRATGSRYILISDPIFDYGTTAKINA